jgi:hypothetical protein
MPRLDLKINSALLWFVILPRIALKKAPLRTSEVLYLDIRYSPAPTRSSPDTVTVRLCIFTTRQGLLGILKLLAYTH